MDESILFKNIYVPSQSQTLKKIFPPAADQSLNLQVTPPGYDRAQNMCLPAIKIDPGAVYQEIDGFGCALTGGSAQLLKGLSHTESAKLLHELFATDGNAIGLSYLRVSIGASDLDARVFSYHDTPPGSKKNNGELPNFSIAQDKKALIPVLKQILAINPRIKLLATSWSPPAWMKTNGDSKGGSLKQEHYETYALYLAKYIKAMRAEGINIDAITIQNEPLNPGNNPSMHMTAREQGLFIKNYLGPVFRKEGLRTKIIVFDHNCDRPDYPMSILADGEARKYIDGSAFHLYAGKITALSTVHNAYPDKNIYFTEQWLAGPGNFSSDLKWHLENIIIGATRNWSKTVLEWNLASDSNYRPHTDGGCANCQGALTIGQRVKRSASYYALAHASKFVRPGSVRIASNFLPSQPNVAFKTPAGDIILVVLNGKSATSKFNIQYLDKTASVSLPGNSVGTFVIRARSLTRSCRI